MPFKISNFENKPEAVPTPEEVLAIFEKLVEGKNYQEKRKLEDKNGLYLWEIVIPEEFVDGEGGNIGYKEYAYMRKGEYPEGQASGTAIHLTFYDADDFPLSGYNVADFIDGKWVLNE